MSPDRSVTARWSAPEQLVAVLRRRWDTGIYLRAHAAGEAWQAVTLPVRGPTADDLLERLDDCRSWVAGFERGAAGFTLVYKEVRGRQLGTNRIPARVSIDSFAQLCRLLRTEQEVKTLDMLTATTRTAVPSLQEWVAAHPLVALRHAERWPQVLATVRWIAACDRERTYLRHIDVDGVDTKFVEQHQQLLDQLLRVVLPTERVEVGPATTTFARRFGFLDKPSYTRLRVLDPDIDAGTWGFTEMAVRSDELARRDPGASTIFIVENEVTYLAFPPARHAIVVFGSGFALGGVAALPWLEGRDVFYWGDIDTHGFDILSRLRSRLPGVRSLLMDRETLLAHPRQWVREPSPTTRAMSALHSDEAALYRDLVEDTYGPSLRLEQERVRFSLVRATLAAISKSPTPSR